VAVERADDRLGEDSRSVGLPLIILLGILSTFGPLSMDLYLPGLPEMAGDLGASASAAQLTMTTCMIGLAAGQVVMGPVSDQLGRRRPLLAALVAFSVLSLLCALAPSVWVLLGERLLQGLAGATGIVIAGAIVRDLTGGETSARLFAALMTVASLAPLLAPLAGGQLLHITDWRGTFYAQVGIGLVLLVACLLMLDETLPAQRRTTGGLRATGAALRLLSRDRTFAGLTIASALAFCALAIYLGGGSFVLEEIYGLSPQLYSVVFAANAGGIVVASQISRRLVGRFGAQRLLWAGMAVSATGGVGTLLAVLTDAPLGFLLAGLFLVVSAIGLIRPNAMAIGLQPHPTMAGSAAGLFGLTSIGLSAALLPVAGVAGAHTAVPMAIAMCATALAAPLVLAGATRRRQSMRVNVIE
jgi:DHA1 family bicyclomycin/chloramphenicol resistance-like MFS transporter